MKPEQTRAFAVTTTAEIEVLRQAVGALLAMALKPMPPDKRDAFLTDFEQEAGEAPAMYDQANPDVSAFYEEVAAELPHHAAKLAQAVRTLLS